MPQRREVSDTAYAKDGNFYDERGGNGNGARLPSYKDEYNVSVRLTLQLTDCDRALRSTIKKARLIVFETVKRRHSLVSRLAKRSQSITLEGAARRFDEQLVALLDELEGDLDVNGLTGLRGYTPALSRLLERMLEADKTFQDGNAVLKRKILRIEKSFTQSIVEPLKRNLIESQKPVFSLFDAVEKTKVDLAEACAARAQIVTQASDQIKASTGWREAEALSDKIEELTRRAKKTGWKQYEDQRFADLQMYTMFDRADGPQSVIDYIESILRTAK